MQNYIFNFQTKDDKCYNLISNPNQRSNKYISTEYFKNIIESMEDPEEIILGTNKYLSINLPIPINYNELICYFEKELRNMETMRTMLFFGDENFETLAKNYLQREYHSLEDLNKNYEIVMNTSDIYPREYEEMCRMQKIELRPGLDKFATYDLINRKIYNKEVNKNANTPIINFENATLLTFDEPYYETYNMVQCEDNYSSYCKVIRDYEKMQEKKDFNYVMNMTNFKNMEYAKNKNILVNDNSNCNDFICEFKKLLKKKVKDDLISDFNYKKQHPMLQQSYDYEPESGSDNDDDYYGLRYNYKKSEKYLNINKLFDSDIYPKYDYFYGKIEDDQVDFTHEDHDAVLEIDIVNNYKIKENDFEFNLIFTRPQTDDKTVSYDIYIMSESKLSVDIINQHYDPIVQSKSIQPKNKNNYYTYEFRSSDVNVVIWKN